jgi:hypothetical protein
MQTSINETNEKTLKRQKGLGRLNRLIAAAQSRLSGLGYDMRRFTRNYDNGTALSSCKRTGAMVTVNINGKTEAERFMGEAFSKQAEHAAS